jgi:hypothetical protein
MTWNLAYDLENGDEATKMPSKAHAAYAMNCAPREGYDWRVFCRQCGDSRPRQIGTATRRSEAVAVAAAHNKQARP